MELLDPPPGLTLREVLAVEDGLVLVLEAKEGSPPVGFTDNLIVHVARARTEEARDGKSAGKHRKAVPIGVLPAIPIEIVAP